MKISCPACGQHYECPDKWEGKEITCEKCSKSFYCLDYSIIDDDFCLNFFLSLPKNSIQKYACGFAIRNQEVSNALLQKKLQIGYYRSEELINLLLFLGIIKPSKRKGIYLSTIDSVEDDALPELVEKLIPDDLPTIPDEEVKSNISEEQNTDSTEPKPLTPAKVNFWNKKLPSGCGCLILILAIFFIFTFLDKQTRRPEYARKQYEKEENGTISDASGFVKNEVKKSLVSPSTATIKITNRTQNSAMRNQYTITGYADSQNVYGAMIRKNFVAEVLYQKSNDSYILVSLDFSAQ